MKHVIIDQRRTPLNLMRATLALRRAVRELNPEIIHAHMMTSAALAFLVRPVSRSS